MASIREYTKRKEKNNNESFSQRILRHRLQIIYRTILAVVLVAAVVIVVILQIKNRVYETYEVVHSIERKNITDSNTIAFHGNVLTYSRDGVNCTDASGTVLWNQTFEMQNPMCSISGNKVAFGDYNGSTIYMLGTEGLEGQVDTKMPIRSFCISQNGVVATVLDGGSTTWIYLFNTAGEEIAYFKTSMQNSGYPVRISISPNGKLVSVAHLQVGTGSMVTSVAFYNFDKVGKNNIDNYASGYDYPDEVVPMLQFLDNESAFAVSDGRIMLYRGGERPVMQSETLINEEIQSVYYNESYIGLVFFDVTGAAAYRMDVYNKEGKLVESVKINMDYTHIAFHRDKILIYNETECVIHKVGGADLYSGTFDKAVYAMVPTTSNHRYLLVTNDTIDTIELK